MSDIEFDDDGFAVIHHTVAAEKELLMSIEKCITGNSDYLECETKDSLSRTPLLLAVDRNKPKSVDKLLELGARIAASDNLNHGVVEICVMKENVDMFRHFVQREHPGFNVWKKLVGFIGANTDEEAEKAALMVDRISKTPDNGTPNPYWQSLVDNNIVAAIIKVCESDVGESVKARNMSALSNIIELEGVPEMIAKHKGVKIIVDLIGKGIKAVFISGTNIIRAVCLTSTQLASKVNDAGFIAIAMKLMSTPEKLNVQSISNIVLAVGYMAKVSPELQKSIGSSGIFQSFKYIFEHGEFQSCIPLLTSLTKAISGIVAGNPENQDLCIEADLATSLIMVSRATKYKDLQTAAINALHALSEKNRAVSKRILSEGAVLPLMQILKKSRALQLQESIAMLLWSLAGEDINERRAMASLMGVNLLIEFLGAAGASADNLNYIGAVGLGVLAQGAHNKQVEIADANGIAPLVRQLRSSSSSVVTAVIQTLRHLCLSIGYVANTSNQKAIAAARGLKFLVALMAYSKAELIQVESALSIAAVSLGNADNLASLSDNPDFTYLHMIRLLYSENDQVRTLAGAALATFSYNCVSQQQEIANNGGVRWNNFASLLQSEDLMLAVNASFQVVVLSRIIPDREPAISSAEGIKTLMNCLEKTTDDDVRALAADCIARLAHTRAGVPAAMISIKAVPLLCRCLLLQNDQVQGAASVALGYLSFDHSGERELLHMCRDEVSLVHIIKYYTRNYKLSTAFLEGWKHFVVIGLPGAKLNDSLGPSLSQQISAGYMVAPKEMPPALYALTEESGSTRSHANYSSRASAILASIRDDASQFQSRSSQITRVTRRSHFPRNKTTMSPSMSQTSERTSPLVVGGDI